MDERDKVRIRFQKYATLRLLSHHDLMRTFERMLRRAQLPFRSSNGFHPQPRLIFALSLPLGVLGRNEVVELELTQPLEPTEVLARLQAQAPTGLHFHTAKRIPPKASAVVRRAIYQLAVPRDEEVLCAERCQSLMNEPECWVVRSRPQPREVNIRPYLRQVHVRGDRLELDIWVTPTGSARAEEVIDLLGARAWLEAGAVLERTWLELRDECALDAGDPEPDLPRLPCRPLTAQPEKLTIQPQPAPTARPHWAASPNGPVVE